MNKYQMDYKPDTDEAQLLDYVATAAAHGQLSLAAINNELVRLGVEPIANKSDPRSLFVYRAARDAFMGDQNSRARYLAGDPEARSYIGNLDAELQRIETEVTDWQKSEIRRDMEQQPKDDKSPQERLASLKADKDFAARYLAGNPDAQKQMADAVAAVHGAKPEGLEAAPAPTGGTDG